MNDIVNNFTRDLNRSEMEQLLHQVAWNDGFGCFNRKGFENLVWPQIRDKARWIIYFDVDEMHELNEKHGAYEPVDEMIKDVFSVVRSTDYIAGQWKSGDEFVVVLTEAPNRKDLDPEGMQERLIQELAKHGMSATFAIEPVLSPNLARNVKPAADSVAAAKRLRGRSRGL